MKIDLKTEYDRLNELIFENQLPENIILKWDNSKKSLGRARIKENINKEVVYQISISHFFLCTEKEYIETLIHEMIHILMAEKKEFKNDKRVHGKTFKKYMNDINMRFPEYNIKIKEDAKMQIDVSKMALQYGFFLKTEDNKNYFNLYKSEFDSKIIKKLISRISFGYNIKKGDLYIFQGRYSEIASAPIRKNMKTLSGKLQYLHNKGDMDNLFEKITKGTYFHYKIEKESSIIHKLLKNH